MDDTIKRSDALKVLERCRHRLEGNGCTYKIMLEMMEDIPSAEKHGEWIPNSPYTGLCSECGGEGNLKNNYCPDCGAKMKGADDEK